MKQYKYLLIDDDDMDRLATSFYLKKYDFLIHAASFSSSSDGLDYIEKNDVDILFLDIDMPNLSGLELLKKVEDKIICTIFITSHSEYAVDGFELNALDFIIKPLLQERFDTAIAKLKDYLDIRQKANLFKHSFNNKSILIKEGRHYIKIDPYEIVYLEALKDYTRMTLLDKRRVTIHGNMGSVLKKEDYLHFIRIHKSYAIQKQYIQSIHTNEITLVDNITLPIGLNYRKSLLELLT